LILEERMFRIKNHLSPKFVIFLDELSRNEVIEELVNLLFEKKAIHDKKSFYQAIIEREKIVTTGIGMGVAIPHAKLAEYDNFFIAVGILKNGVDWKAVDGTLVRIVFLIGGPDDKQTEYLRILSGITVALKDEERRKAILLAESPEEVIQAFS